jgi:dihydroneopterin aldolase
MGRHDRFELRALRVVGAHGVLEEEQLRAQPFEVDLDLYLDLSAAGTSDDLSTTVDYGAVLGMVEMIVRCESHRLLEKVTQRIADDILSVFLKVDAVTVTIRKLRPPVPYDVASTGVTITRRREHSAD